MDYLGVVLKEGIEWECLKLWVWSGLGFREKLMGNKRRKWEEDGFSVLDYVFRFSNMSLVLAQCLIFKEILILGIFRI